MLCPTTISRLESNGQRCLGVAPGGAQLRSAFDGALAVFFLWITSSRPHWFKFVEFNQLESLGRFHPRCQSIGNLRSICSQRALPDNRHEPPHIEQGLLRSLVTDYVGLEFCLPEVRSGFRDRSSISTVLMPVPETAVDENSNTEPRKDQIRRPRQVLAVKSIAKSAGMHLMPQSQFRSSVVCPDTCHHAGTDFGWNDVDHSLLHSSR